MDGVLKMEFTSDGSGRFSRMEIVDSGRRRRFTDEAKLAIVAESYDGPPQVTITAQRHGITRWQLSSWRQAVRDGRLTACSPSGFIPARIVADPVKAVAPPLPVAPAASPITDQGRMEVVSANGRRVVVDRNVDVEVLVQIMRGLETLR